VRGGKGGRRRAPLHEMLRLVRGSPQLKPTDSRNEGGWRPSSLDRDWRRRSSRKPKRNVGKAHPPSNPDHQQRQEASNSSPPATCSSKHAPAGVGLEWDAETSIRQCSFFTSFSLSSSSSNRSLNFHMSIDTQDAPNRIYPAEVRAHSSKWARRRQRAPHS
jgi:hypothetical protein